jgi:hypothetical protein
MQLLQNFAPRMGAAAVLPAESAVPFSLDIAAQRIVQCG